MKNSININLDRKQVIAKLNHKRVEFDALEQYALRKEAELMVAKEEWKKKLTESVIFWIQQGDAKVVSSYFNDCSLVTSVKVEIPRELEPEPKWDNTMGETPRYYQSKIASIDRTLAILNMCSDDTIKSKAYEDVLEILL